MGCGASGPKPLTIGEMIQGLKDTLNVAVKMTCQQLGAPGGFLHNPKVKIEIPTVLGDVMNAARDLPGIGDKVREFEAKINSAAEKSSGAAVDIFVAAIGNMNFRDASAVLNGPPTGATQYFWETTQDALRSKFNPIIDNTMKDEGVVIIFDGIIAAWSAAEAAAETARELAAAAGNMFGSLMGGPAPPPKAPPKQAPVCDLADYICEEGLKGLFQVLAEKEQAVRTGAAYHNTDAMKRCYAPKPQGK